MRWTYQEDVILANYYSKGYKAVQKRLKELGLKPRTKAAIQCRGSNLAIAQEYHEWTKTQDKFMLDNANKGGLWLQSKMKSEFGADLKLGNVRQRLRRLKKLKCTS